MFVCGPEHFPANLIKSVSLKIYNCFAMYSKPMFRFESVPSGFINY
jgi:hypothetical protein